MKNELLGKDELNQRIDKLSVSVQIPYFAKSLSELSGHIASWKDGYLQGMKDPDANKSELDRVKALLDEAVDTLQSISYMKEGFSEDVFQAIVLADKFLKKLKGGGR